MSSLIERRPPHCPFAAGRSPALIASASDTLWGYNVIMDYNTGMDFSRRNITHLRPSISLRMQDSNGSPVLLSISIVQAHELHLALSDLIQHYPLPEKMVEKDGNVTLKHASGYVEKSISANIELI